MKDYYKILEVDQDASEEQIRKGYRRLAFKYHPDRNPGDLSAEERFKEIAEAYGVLTDPIKRNEYDKWLRVGPTEGAAGQGFPYSQEEIFQDLFRDPRFRHVFQDLFGEFERAGYRFDQRFFDKVFFGGRGVFFGGIFVWGPFGSERMKFGRQRQRSHLDTHQTRRVKPPGFLKQLGQKIGRLLSGGRKALPQETKGFTVRPQDLTYNLTLPSEEAQRGTWVTISIDRGQGNERLKVRIPPGIRSGTRLRLTGKGRYQAPEDGDLYLTVNIA